MMASCSTREGPLAIRIDDDGDSLTIRLVGELDIATAPMLEELLRSASSGNRSSVTLDLDSVAFIDSSGLRILIVAAQSSRRDGDRLCIRCGPSSVRRMIELTGIERLLPLVPSSDHRLTEREEVVQ